MSRPPETFTLFVGNDDDTGFRDQLPSMNSILGKCAEPPSIISRPLTRQTSSNNTQSRLGYIGTWATSSLEYGQVCEAPQIFLIRPAFSVKAEGRRACGRFPAKSDGNLIIDGDRRGVRLDRDLHPVNRVWTLTDHGRLGSRNHGQPVAVDPARHQIRTVRPQQRNVIVLVVRDPKHDAGGA